MAASKIRPGMNVDCAITIDENKDILDVRKATIYDASSSKIIISQTSPELLPSNVGNKIAVTYVDSSQDVRMGKSGVIISLIKDYHLSSSQIVNAAILTGFSGIKKFNLRFAYRLRPSDGFGIRLLLNGDTEVDIIDLSALGVRFRHEKLRDFSYGQKIHFHLSTKQKSYKLNAVVVRKNDCTESSNKIVEHVAVRFTDLNGRVEDELNMLIREIERKSVFKQMYS